MGYQKWVENQPSKEGVNIRYREFPLSSLDVVKLRLSKEAKYLGIVLDSKLSCKRSTEERSRKALCAFYSWMIYWMYTSIVTPVLTYGSLVWRNAVENRTRAREFEKIQRLACVRVT